jgi:hypothetical protein
MLGYMAKSGGSRRGDLARTRERTSAWNGHEHRERFESQKEASDATDYVAGAMVANSGRRSTINGA